MRTKGNHPLEHVQTQDLPVMVRVYFEFSQLKQLYRQGWLRRGVPPDRCESVAEHSFGVAVLALFLADAYRPDLDRDKLLRIALLHDFGEIYAGDLVPADAIDPAEKHRREAQSITRVFAKLANGPAYVAAWQEYETGESAEARLIRQIDRLEMALQASVYEHQGLVDPSEFFASAEQALSDAPELLDLVEQLRDLKRP
ncbi:MAG: HD domain-containing protein [Anaerolineae bacterium]|nr:HD domain-containing protein [Anaerolineae bacterium]